MGYDNLQPALERFKLTAGFIAGGGRAELGITPLTSGPDSRYTSVPAAARE